MQNVCGWIAQAGTLAAHSRLSGVERADWLVVGAGITGLSAAHTLAQLHPQARILIVDRQSAAQGASARNSGFVVAHETPCGDELQGRPAFADYQLDTAIGRAASQEVFERVVRHGIDCELKASGYFFAVNDPDKLTDVEAKLQTLRATGATSPLLTSVLQRAQPGWLPPKPLLDIGAMLRMRVEAIGARSEL